MEVVALYDFLCGRDAFDANNSVLLNLVFEEYGECGDINVDHCAVAGKCLEIKSRHNIANECV